jgi:SAM-dependent methyltransferase
MLSTVPAWYAFSSLSRIIPIYGIPPKDYIGWVPSPMKIVHRMLELAEIQEGETIYDLGCGDGRILITAAKKYGARGVGIEVDNERIEDARRRALPFADRITFRRQNVFEVDLRRADVVTIYLLPVLNKKLMPQLRKMKRGARIVTHSFALDGMEPYKTAHISLMDSYKRDIFAYRIPLQKA